MYRSAVILIVSFALLLLMWIVVAQMLVTVDLLARVDESAGTVQVMRGSAARPARLGMLVRAGERIRTGADGRAGVHWADGTRVRVGPNSEFVIHRCRRNRAKNTRHSCFRLNLGEIWIRLRGALEPGSKFEVETPTIVAAVRGTIFGLKVAPDGTTELQVYRGEVEIRGDGLGQAVEPGRCATVGKGRFAVRDLSEAEQENWRQAADIVGPRLEITEPCAGVATSSPLAAVRGITEDGAEVSINGERVKVTPKGTFRWHAPLVEGPNQITVVSCLGELRTTVCREITYANPTREIVLTGRPSPDPNDPADVIEITAVLHDAAGELVADETPVEMAADRGDVERYQRTQRGAVTTKWRPGRDHALARVTATSGGATATIIVGSPPQATPAP